MSVRIGVMEKVLKQPRESVFAAAADLGLDGIEIEVLADPAGLRAIIPSDKAINAIASPLNPAAAFAGNLA